ncbi:UNVERIFIED_CONTAM: hypothetical protein FKN15_007909 [Acipenser sinensis]
MAFFPNSFLRSSNPNRFLLECRRVLKIPALEALPGGGWDNLRNVDLGRVMNFNYSQCRTTEDGSYLIPDEVFTIPQKHSRVEQSSELIDSWLQYRSVMASSINSEASFSIDLPGTFLFSINGKYSSESKRVKTHQVRDGSVTTRVQVRNLLYSVQSTPGFSLDPWFQDQAYKIAEALENNQTRLAGFLSESLVLNYGTHVLTTVHAGASLVQEDFLKSTVLSGSQDSSSSRSISVSAGLRFFNVINVGFGNKSGASSSTQDSASQQYIGNITYSVTESHGGALFYPGITLQKWQESIANNLVAIDRTGLPLPAVFNQQSLLGLSEPTIRKLVLAVTQAIKTYYQVNTVPGCVKVESPNFNFHANVDDGSCQATVTNFTFGGVFQDCVALTTDSQDLCHKLEQKNPLTGAYSCPEQYNAVKLQTDNKEQGYSTYECHQECKTTFWFIKSCNQVCGDIYRVRKARFNAYWCVATQRQVPSLSGYLFGGLYTSASPNPLTKSQSCPAGFVELKLFDGMKVCVSNDYEMQAGNSVPFGGFFSCHTGNPLSVERRGEDKENGEVSAQKCPKGFSQHLAGMSDGCQIMYCVRSGEFTEGQLPDIRLPPFIRKPLVSNAMTNTIMIMSEGNLSWVKDSKTKLWKIAQPEDFHQMSQLFNPRKESLSPGAYVGVALGVLAGVGVTIAMGVYGIRRWWRRRGGDGEFHEIEEGGRQGEGEEEVVRSSITTI